MLFAVEGAGTIGTDGVKVTLSAGSLAYVRSAEELRIANEGSTGLTLFGFLAPPFPLRPGA